MSKHHEFARKNFNAGYQEALADINAKLKLGGVSAVKQWLADNLNDTAVKERALVDHAPEPLVEAPAKPKYVRPSRSKAAIAARAAEKAAKSAA